MHTKFEENFLLVKLTEFDVADMFMAGQESLQTTLPNGIKLNLIKYEEKKDDSPYKIKPPKFSYKTADKIIEIKIGYRLLEYIFHSSCRIPECFEPSAKVVYTIDIPIGWLKKRGVDIDNPVKG